MKQSLIIWLLLISITGIGQDDKPNPKPRFEPEGGLYPGEDVEVVITSKSPDAKIFYTLDGTSPNSESTRYTKPIRVRDVTVIRAKAYVNGRPSEVVTQTYFTNRKHTTAVVSVVADPAKFFDDSTGIYVKGCCADTVPPFKGANFWKHTEIVGNVEIYEEDGDDLINQECGIRIFGGFSRSNAQKSLALIARDRYGKNRFSGKIFPELQNEKFKGLVLRNSGGDFNKTQCRDAFMTHLAKPTGLDVQAHRPSAVYINGRYWGLMNIREKINEHYIEDHHDVDDDSLDLMEHRMDVKEGSSKRYKKLLAWLKEADMSSNDNVRELNTMMDIDNFIAYNIAEVYSDNRDAGGNIRYWRPWREGGRWRWIFYDLDMGLSCTNWKGYKRNTLVKFTSKNDEKWPDPPWSTFIIRKLLENDSLQHVYINTLADHLNWVYHKDTAVRKLDEVAVRMANEMVHHAERWGGDSARWAKYINIVREFVQNRPHYMRAHVLEKFGLEDTAVVELMPTVRAEGKLYLNGYRITTPFSGVYFKGVPVKLEAVPRFDYAFTGWEGHDSKEPVLFVDPSMASNLKPMFEPKPGSEGPNIVINEFSYDNADDAGDWVELVNMSSASVNLEGWVLKDESDDNEFLLPDVTLKEGEYIVIIEEENAFQKEYGSVNSIQGLSVKFSSEGDKIRLYDHTGLLADSVTYSTEKGWPTSSRGVYELLSPEKDNADAKNWVAPVKATPGYINPNYERFLAAKEQTATLRIWFMAGGGVLMLLGLTGILIWRRRVKQRNTIEE